jgi:arylsulfatase A-like enzyme
MNPNSLIIFVFCLCNVAQFYSFNAHYPYMKHTHYDEPDRYYSSLRTLDDFLRELFSILREKGLLKNTIIVGSSDHGEERIGKKYPRLNTLTPRILHAVSYIYYPSKIVPDQKSADRLRSNTQQLVSTLDLHTTILGILKASHLNVNLSEYHPGCVHGVDLAAVNISDTRVVAASNAISTSNQLKLVALMTKQSALYNRRAKYEYKELSQGKNNTYVMSFDGCERNECLATLDGETKDHFKEALNRFKNYSFGLIEGRESHFVEFFESILV